MSESTEYTSLGTVPSDESCICLGPDYDPKAARAEARRFIDLLWEMFPEAPDGARFKLESCPHDFGNYYDVVVVVPSTDEGFAWGRLVDGFSPATWDGGKAPRFLPKPCDGRCTRCGGEDDLRFVARKGMERGEWACPSCEEALGAAGAA